MTATFSDRKLHTISLLAQLEDEEILILIELLLMETAKGDWADSLSKQDQADIAEGLADLEAGNTEDFDSFNARMTAKYP
jgi:hypothetical protein